MRQGVSTPTAGTPAATESRVHTAGPLAPAPSLESQRASFNPVRRSPPFRLSAHGAAQSALVDGHGLGEGAALFGLNEPTQELLQYISSAAPGTSATRGRQQAVAHLKEWSGRKQMAREATDFLYERIAAMKLMSLDRLVILACEIHESKTCTSLVDVLVEALHRHPLRRRDKPGTYLLEMAPQHAAGYVQRVAQMRDVVAADPVVSGHAGGLLALEVSSSVDRVHLQRALTMSAIHSATRRGMRVAGGDPDRNAYQGLPAGHRRARREPGILRSATEHAERGGPVMLSVGIEHLLPLYRAFVGKRPVIGFGPLGNYLFQSSRGAAAASLLIKEDNLMPFKISPDIELGWMNLLDRTGGQGESSQFGASLPHSTPPAPAMLLHWAASLRAMAGGAHLAARDARLRDLQSALARSDMDRPARSELLKELFITTAAHGRIGMSPSQVDWLRRMCDGFLYEYPPKTAEERAEVALLLCTAIHPQSQGESAHLSAWAVSRLERLTMHPLGEHAPNVLHSVLAALHRQPTVSSAHKARLIDSIERLVGQTGSVDGISDVARIPEVATYLGPDLHARLARLSAAGITAS